MEPIPVPLLAVVLVLIDVVTVASLAIMYRHRDDAHIVFRGWTAILSRSVLMLLWIHFTIVGDLGLIPDHGLCLFFAAALLFFYAYLASVSVQCWHTYVCWSSLALIIATGNTRLTVLKPPGFLRYRRQLTSTLFQVGLGIILVMAFGATSFTAVLKTGFSIASPTSISMHDRCSNSSDVITAVVFIVASLTLAYLSHRLYLVGDRFGLGVEVGGIAGSLAVVAVLLGLETTVDASTAHVLQFAQTLVIVSMNLVWALGVPLYVVRVKTHQHGLSYTPTQQHQLRHKHHHRQTSSNATTVSESGRSTLSMTSTLADVLHDVDGARVLFKKFCISEFSVENILWLESSANFHSKYSLRTATSSGDNQAGQQVDVDASFSAFVDDLDSLIQGFIRSDGILTLNLSASVSASALEFAYKVDRSTTDTAVMCETMRRGVQLLHKIDLAVMDLMKDTFSRFRRSPQYERFVQRISTIVELDLSQTMPTAPSPL